VRIVFLGSGAFAVPSLEALLASEHEVAALVTQPDRAAGRGRALASPPTKPVAQARGVPVLQPHRVREPEARETLRRLDPELQVVVAFGQILPREVIDLARRGTVNVHASLLPRLRGAAPIQWSIAGGDTETGVSTMMIDEGLDTGPILLQRRTPIGGEETAADLLPRLAKLGAEVLLETIHGLEDGTLRPVPQDDALATKAPLLRKDDGWIDWERTASEIAARVRGFHPWPGSFTRTPDARMLKVLRARVDASAPGAAADPGTITVVDADGLGVRCGGGTQLHLLEVQPESRKAMPADVYARGARLGPGGRLG